MKIWILKPKDNLPKGDNPWNPWYGKAFGFVICAKTEEEARRIAHENAGDENRGEFLNKRIAKTTKPWMDEKYTTCEELIPTKESSVIMRDFCQA